MPSFFFFNYQIHFFVCLNHNVESAQLPTCLSFFKSSSNSRLSKMTATKRLRRIWNSIQRRTWNCVLVKKKIQQKTKTTQNKTKKPTRNHVNVRSDARNGTFSKLHCAAESLSRIWFWRRSCSENIVSVWAEVWVIHRLTGLSDVSEYETAKHWNVSSSLAGESD